MSSPEEWFKSLPIVTKAYFVGAVGTTVLVSMGVISPFLLFLDFELVFKKFQIWRLLCNFLFFGKFGMPFLFNVVMLVRYCGKLETDYYSSLERGKSTADFVFMCLFGMTLMTVIAYFWEGLAFLGPALVFMVIYVWSRKDPEQPVNFWGFLFKAWHLPFVLLGVSMLLGSSPVLDIVGIVVGHLYHFLMDIVPKVYNKNLLHCPEFIYQAFESRRAGGARPATAWQRGQGHRLG
jgi:Derlin-2/3